MPFEHISVSSLKSLIEEKPVTLVDIRDQPSYIAGHIENAIHIGNHNIQEFLAKTDKSVPIVVCCYHGNTSQGAANFFNEQGFVEAYSLDGGYAEWANS